MHPFVARNLIDLIDTFCYNASVHEHALFLRLLAEEVYTASLEGGQRVLDAGDFREWLVEAAERAQDSRTVDEFFSRLRHSNAQ
jgi:hypothetical protein